MNSKEALELAILEYEKYLETDENNQWVKNVLKGLKEIKQDLERLEVLEKENKKWREIIGCDLCEALGREILLEENEKLKKAFKILTQRIVIKAHKNYLFGGRHLDVASTTMKLTDEEYELLKEVLENA